MAFNFSPKVATNGLVMYLDAANSRSYPGTGTTWSDLTFNRNSGSLINGPTYDSNNGGSIVFDGVNDYVGVTYSTTLNLIQTHTLDCWFYSPSAGQATSDGFLIRAGVGFDEQYGLAFAGGSGQLRYEFYDLATPGFQTRYSTGIFNRNTWCNATVVKNSTTLYLYLNGSLDSVQVGSNTLPATFGAMNIGSNSANPGQKYYGKIASARIYNRALSAAEVLQNYRATKSRFKAI